MCLSKAKVGDIVFDAMFGYGKIVNIKEDCSLLFTISVMFEDAGCEQTYTTEGKFLEESIYATCWPVEQAPEFYREKYKIPQSLALTIKVVENDEFWRIVCVETGSNKEYTLLKINKSNGHNFRLAFDEKLGFDQDEDGGLIAY